jgi:16S rRNA processing protein RimM
MPEERVCLGQIGAAHGVRGEVRLRSFTAEPAAIADYGPLEDDHGRVFEIEALRPAKDHFVARFAGVSDRNAAERLVNIKLYVPRERLPAPAVDEFYHADLIGLAVLDQDGARRGTVLAIHNFGAGDLVEVKPEIGDKTELVPFDQAHVPNIDIAAGQIVIVPSAFADDNDAAADSSAKRSR